MMDKSCSLAMNSLAWAMMSCSACKKDQIYRISGYADNSGSLK
jgi:hypothetical protein